MRYQPRNVPLSVLLSVFLFCIFIVSLFLSIISRHLIHSRQVTVLPAQVVKFATISCNVNIGGEFKYESTGGNDASRGYLYAKIELINRSGITFLPGGELKLGLRWLDTSSRADQYRIEFPNEMAPGEQLVFSARMPMHSWSDLDHIMSIELMSEGAYWCSDYGGMRLALSRADNSKTIDVTPLKN